jgi:cation transport regulator ChaC
VDRELTEYNAQEDEVDGMAAGVPFDDEEGGEECSGEWVVPGVPIVRSSTPRPLSFGLLLPTTGSVPQSPEQEGKTTFPIEAPSAPPLPEESLMTGNENEPSRVVEATPLPLSGKVGPLEDTAAEFIWLFEYGVEMDIAFLNSPERLDGFALLYGPAVLKGYELTFDVINARSGGVVATILPSRQRGAEVWGVLYRVPRRFVERAEEEPALLDVVHSATPPNGLFERLQVVVHEAYRSRDILCITYIASATARNHYHLLPRNKQMPEHSYVERLLASARKQMLPGGYLDELAELVSLTSADDDEPGRTSTLAADTPVEQNTEPLPMVGNDTTTQLALTGTQEAISRSTNGVGLVMYAVYLLLVVLAVFVLAVLQGLGFGSEYLTANFTLLGIPWFMLVYGLLGGCVSCIIALGRRSVVTVPGFVLITWFARPLLGALLAALAYLLLNSGMLVFGGTVAQHAMLYSLVAVLAGACEGWLFFRKR